MRSFKVLSASALATVTLVAGTGSHQAQAAPVADLAWNARVDVYTATQNSPAPVRDLARGVTDTVVNAIAPGVIAQKEAEIEAARQAAEAAARAEAERLAAEKAEADRLADIQARRVASGVDYGPCPITAKACVDIDGNRAWLQVDGVASYGPVAISSGKPGQETTRGDLKVLRKVKDEVSYEFNMAPMPNSVYFTNTGMAFHSGSVNVMSAGCIHLEHNDSIAFFDYLNVGDQVFIY
ncbi:MAG: L,D-transpeptidase [Corynebacterium sp.]|nr:L,D-transpeptidase [Corynebacterium sp.]